MEQQKRREVKIVCPASQSAQGKLFLKGFGQDKCRSCCVQYGTHPGIYSYPVITAAALVEGWEQTVGEKYKAVPHHKW